VVLLREKRTGFGLWERDGARDGWRSRGGWGASACRDRRGACIVLPIETVGETMERHAEDYLARREYLLSVWLRF
jgi:hypothetical protein